MLKQSTFKNSAFQSVLRGASVLKKQDEKTTHKVATELTLTALIDAFSILVIFLLMNFSSQGDILQPDKDIKLPQSTVAETLTRNPIVKIDQGRFYIEGQEIQQSQIVSALIDLRKTWPATHADAGENSTLILQGDRKMKYENMSSLVQAASQAGYSDLKFAVTMR